jgi:uncharacterized protein (TIGR01777 family)
MPKRILITGASGLVGTKLTELLIAKNHSVIHLRRNKKENGIPSLVWNVEEKKIDEAAFDNVDTIVHLAGANVGEKRWTPQRKKEIFNSRVDSTKLLHHALQNKNHLVKTFVAASAIGYYGFEGNEIFTEENKNGNGFLAEVTKCWEDEVDKISLLGIRVVKLRIGIVLSKEGGALKKMAMPIRYNIGSPLGSGQQQISWIHIDDLSEIFVKAIEDEKLNGAYNATANWASNESMKKTIAKVLNKPLWLPNIPTAILKMMLGEMAEIVLRGSKVSSEKIKRTGFHFKHENLEEALKDIFKK